MTLTKCCPQPKSAEVSYNYATDYMFGDSYLPSNSSEVLRHWVALFHLVKCIGSLDLAHCHEKYFIHVIAF